MKKLLLVIVVTFGLTGCETLQSIKDYVIETGIFEDEGCEVEFEVCRF